MRWRPGSLKARLLSGLEVELAAPAASTGWLADEDWNAVLYQDLFPGLDLLARVRAGAVEFELQFREWSFELAPEQIDLLFVDAELDADGSLLNSVETRAASGESYEHIPLYFDSDDDEFVIDLETRPGISQIQIDDFLEASAAAEEPLPYPEHWRSELYNWLSNGQVRFHFPYPPSSADPDPEGGASSSTAAALMATFKFTHRDYKDQQVIFDSANDESDWGTFGLQESSVSHRPDGTLEVLVRREAAGRGKDQSIRSRTLFKYWNDLNGKVKSRGGSGELVGVDVGYSQTFDLSAYGVVADAPDEIVVYSSLPFEVKKNSRNNDKKMNWAAWDKHLDLPYNLVQRPIAGNDWLETSSWDWRANQGAWHQPISRGSILWGPLYTAKPGSTVPRAVTEVTAILDDRLFAIPMLVAMPFDEKTCQKCTNAHSDPAVQALNGDYRVGSGFFQLHMRLTIRNSTSLQQATLSATSVGGHQDDLYPGATRSWDLKLVSLAGPPDTLELQELGFEPGHLEFWFTDPASGAVLSTPTLTSIGDRVRIHAKLRRARPALYGTTQKLKIAGSFRNAGVGAGEVAEIPIHFKAPEGQPTFTQIYPLVDDNIPDPMGLAWINLPTAGLKGAVATTAQLRFKSGPTQQLDRGQHWDVWKEATLGNDGEIVIYPDQFKVGIYQVELTPCLWPDGLGGSATAHCLAGSKQTLTFEVRQASTPPPTPRPAIDFVTPSSINSPSGGALTLSILGQNLAGATAGTQVTLPQVISNANPLAGSTATKVNVSANLTSSSVCGPRQLQLTTAGGSATRIFNITKPFQNNPNHWAIEAEAAVRKGLKISPFANASGGNAVDLEMAGGSGDLTLRFQVPASSTTYRLYGLYSSPKQARVRATLTLRQGANVVKTYRIGLPQTASGKFNLAALIDVDAPAPAVPFNLQPGQTYELNIASRPGRDYPIFDLFALSDGSLPPTLTELCR